MRRMDKITCLEDAKNYLLATAPELDSLIKKAATGDDAAYMALVARIELDESPPTLAALCFLPSYGRHGKDIERNT